MIEIIFNNFYCRLILAFVIIYMITFVHLYDILHNKFITYILLLLVCIMVLFNIIEDYGLILLLIVLFIFSYYESLMKRK